MVSTKKRSNPSVIEDDRDLILCTLSEYEVMPFSDINRRTVYRLDTDALRIFLDDLIKDKLVQDGIRPIVNGISGKTREIPIFRLTDRGVEHVMRILAKDKNIMVPDKQRQYQPRVTKYPKKIAGASVQEQEAVSEYFKQSTALHPTDGYLDEIEKES